MKPAATGIKYASYRIEELVGSDSYGKLYRAYDESLDRAAALKVLYSALSEHADFVQRFRKNMQDLAQLTNPRIPQIYFFGKQENEYFVALEWCAGGSLANELRKHGRLPLQEALRILSQCIEGLAAAWRLGIAHGNLKPNNVMLGDDREIKIADFGLVPEQRREPDAQILSGAVSFMAPELVDRGAMDFRADIYSLGIILHYMLLNSLPSSRPAEGNLEDDSLPSLVPSGIQALIDRMTRENPRERHNDYDELMREIEGLAATIPEEPVPAVPRAVSVQPDPLCKGNSIFDLLADVYGRMASGVLKVSWLTLKKQFLIRRGEIVSFESSQPDESLESLVIARKWLSGVDSSQNSKDPEDLIRRLLLSRACTLDQFREAYLTQMKETLLQVFQWSAFHGEFFQARIENEPLATLRLSDVLLVASRVLIDGRMIRAQIPRETLINRTPNFEQLLAPFALTPEESFLAYRFEGKDLKPETLGVLTGLPEDTVLRVTYLLQRIGALELRPATPATRRAVPQPAPRRAPAPPAPPPVAAAPPPAVPAAPPAASPPQPKARKRSFEEALIRVDSQVPATPKAVGSSVNMRKAEMCFRNAEKEYGEGNYGKAAHLCKEALQYHQAPPYFQLLGAAYARHPRFQRDAEEAFHKAVELAPADADYHAILAAFYSQRDLWLRARTHCLKALELSPGHRTANSIYQKVLEKKPGKGECWCVWGGSKPAE